MTSTSGEPGKSGNYTERNPDPEVLYRSAFQHDGLEKLLSSISNNKDVASFYCGKFEQKLTGDPSVCGSDEVQLQDYVGAVHVFGKNEGQIPETVWQQFNKWIEAGGSQRQEQVENWRTLIENGMSCKARRTRSPWLDLTLSENPNGKDDEQRKRKMDDVSALEESPSKRKQTQLGSLAVKTDAQTSPPHRQESPKVAGSQVSQIGHSAEAETTASVPSGLASPASTSQTPVEHQTSSATRFENTRQNGKPSIIFEPQMMTANGSAPLQPRVITIQANRFTKQVFIDLTKAMKPIDSTSTKETSKLSVAIILPTDMFADNGKPSVYIRKA